MEVNLATEFSRYLMVRRVCDDGYKLFPPEILKVAYEDKLECSFLEYAEDVKPGEDPIFALRKLDLSYQNNTFFLNWLKLTAGPVNSQKIYDLYVKYVTEWLRRDKKKGYYAKI